MIDWASRIDDLADHLARQYTVEDRAAIDILLAALVPCPRTATSWLILETNWFARDCAPGWFSFGKTWEPCSLARLRARSPWRQVEAETKRWLDDYAAGPPRLFIEPDYERYPYFHRLTHARYLLQCTLRVRTHVPRTAKPLASLDKDQEDRRQAELAAAARYVLEDRAQARPAAPPRFVEPPDFLYYVELLQRLSPWYPDWHVLVQILALMAVRRAYLYGRSETDASDHQAMARLLHDSIPPWTAKALGLLLEGPCHTQTLEKHMGLEEKTRRSGHGAHRELVRLHRRGIIHWNPRQMHWLLVDTHRERLGDLLAGRDLWSPSSTGTGMAGMPIDLRG